MLKRSRIRTFCPLIDISLNASCGDWDFSCFELNFGMS